MAHLDIRIEDPEDVDSEPSPKVLDPHQTNWRWVKAASGMILLLALIAVAGALARNTDSAEETDAPVAAEQAPVEAAPLRVIDEDIAMAVAAVESWERFARTGSLDDVVSAFHPMGPQYELFESGLSGFEPSGRWHFELSNAVVSRTDDQVVVSLDLVVTSPGRSTNTYPYDFVFIPDDHRVWTVVDQRIGARSDRPPASDDLEAAQTAWIALIEATSADDCAGAEAQLTEESARALSNVTTTNGWVSADERANKLMRWTATLDPRVPCSVIALLRQQGITPGVENRLRSWRHVDESGLIATLEIDDGEPTTVPFVAAGDGWKVDLLGSFGARFGEPS